MTSYASAKILLAVDSRQRSLTLVLPVRQAASVRDFWSPIVSALEDLNVRTQVLDGGARSPSEYHGQWFRTRIPSLVFFRSVFRLSTSTLICVEFGLTTVLAAVAARLARKRVILLQEHGGREGVALALWQRGYRRLVCLLPNAYIANTDAAYAELIDVLHVHPEKVFRATVVVPPEREMLASHATPILPNLPRKRPLFLFVGQLIRRKNLEALLAAATTLSSKGYGFEVWIVGDGPERPRLEESAADLMTKGIVRFIGSLANTQIGAAYSAADVFVMPCLRDYRSVAVLEAMRHGKPVIDSVHDGNTHDLMRHEETGLVCDPTVPGALARAMERACLEPEGFKKMGEHASVVLARHTPRAAAVALRDIIDQVMPPWRDGESSNPDSPIRG